MVLRGHAQRWDVGGSGSHERTVCVHSCDCWRVHLRPIWGARRCTSSPSPVRIEGRLAVCASGRLVGRRRLEGACKNPKRTCLHVAFQQGMALSGMTSPAAILGLIGQPVGVQFRHIETTNDAMIQVLVMLLAPASALLCGSDWLHVCVCLMVAKWRV